MDALVLRQFSVLRQSIGDYRAGKLTLNSLIQRIEAVGELVGIDAWKAAVFPIILEIEQINAATITEGVSVTERNEAEVTKSLVKLEKLISIFESKLDS